MKKTTDINPERTEKYQYLEKLNYVPKLIIIASVALIASLLAITVASLGLYSGLSAQLEVKYQNKVIEGYREAVEIEKNRTAKLRLEVDQLEEQINER